jgi:hypothetical protein
MQHFSENDRPVNYQPSFMKQRLSDFVTYIIIVIGLLTFSNAAQANHAYGASISLTKTTVANEYLIRLYVYRNCNSIVVPATQNVTVKSGVTGLTFNTTLQFISSSLLTSNPCMPVSGYNCQMGQGIEEYIFEGLTTLVPSNNWIVYYTECCRDADVTNISNISGYNLYAEATLDNYNFPGNSTPDFNIPPIVYTCLYTPTTLVNALTEPDGDSIVYSIEAPMMGFNANIYSYSWGLSPQTFVTSSSPVTIDPASGAIQFTPSIPQLVTYAVRATEYRNGVESGSTRRDVEFYTLTTVGIEENNSESLINIYPNPATDFITIDLPDGVKADYLIIIDPLGRIIRMDVSFKKNRIEVSKLKEGVYTLQCISNQKVFTSRFIKL